MSKIIVAHIRRHTIGYHYFTLQRQAYGWRQIGADGYAVMDDFGSLHFVERPC
jgi:hypothetical protein